MATPFKNAAVAEARAALDRAYKVTELAAAGDRELTVARLEMTRARNVLQSATEQLNAAQQKHREASVNFQNADSKLRIARSVSYTHLRAHATVLDLVCRILLENTTHYSYVPRISYKSL